MTGTCPEDLADRSLANAVTCSLRRNDGDRVIGMSVIAVAELANLG
jgi:hypothetical protein